MIQRFIALQWKSFLRSPSFKTEIWFRILMILAALYFMLLFLALGVGSFFILQKLNMGDPLRVVNRFMIYYLAADLYFRYMLQKIPVMNIRHFLYLPVQKHVVVRYALGKTLLSGFNIGHGFFFVPFSIVLIMNGYDPLSVLSWHLGFLALILGNNFLNLLLNNADRVFYSAIGLFGCLGFAQYMEWFDITNYTGWFFDAFYDIPAFFLVGWLSLMLLTYAAFNHFRKHMYLDSGLSIQTRSGKTEEYLWLNRFGNLSVFLKNDIKLIRRNKRSKTTVIASVAFLFYGLLFFTGSIEVYENPMWRVFAGIFVSGGFLFTFGQYVPSWDSAYYPLMMSQNIKYEDYLRSKWWLIVIATGVSAVLASFYLYFGWKSYLAVLVGAIYNMGVNSYLVLWGGAYIKTPIDLTSNKKAFGDRQAFNSKTLLLTLPKLFLPILVFWAGSTLWSDNFGFALVALLGLGGFAFRSHAFKSIEKIYKKEKYKTLNAYKHQTA
ncbi:MAG: hypothetical protein RLZZ241_1681 [Bacteroidota bacterium]|jgi:hypothetical protein